jgi:tetratricopeptide (TPR) repeat protein
VKRSEKAIWAALARTRHRFGQWLIDRLRRTTFFGVIGIIGTLVIVIPIISETFHSVVQIDPVVVPAELEEQGFTPQVISAEVTDQLEQIKRGVRAKRSEKAEERLSATSNINASRLELPDILEGFSLTSGEELPDIEIPETNLSLRTIVRFLQDFLHRQPPRVTGEIILAKDLRQQEVLAVTVRIVRADKRSTQSFSQPGTNPELMISTLAQEVLHLADPAQLGLWTYNQGDFDRAEKLLGECEQLDECPEHASKWVAILHGNILMDEDRLAEAEPEYRSALSSRGVACVGILIRYRLSRDDLRACTIAYTELGNLFDVQRKYELAIKQYQSALALSPKEAYAHNNWGNALLDESEYDAAVEQFEVSIAIRPSPYAYDGWGSALLNKNEYKEAIGKYQKALALDPNFAMAYVDWGHTLDSQSEYDLAIEKYQKALALNPKFAIAYSGWGEALNSKAEYDAAIEKFQKAIALNPKYVLPYNEWGNALYAKNQYDLAIEKYQKAIALNPQDAVAYNGWGNALYSKNQYDLAIEKFQKATALDPKYAVAYIDWGTALYVKNENDAAIEKYQKALALDPKLAEAYNGWGNALYSKGEYKAAIARYQEATTLDPKLGFAYESWGMALEAKGDAEQAMAMYRKAFTLRPTDEFLKSKLGIEK